MREQIVGPLSVGRRPTEVRPAAPVARGAARQRPPVRKCTVRRPGQELRKPPPRRDELLAEERMREGLAECFGLVAAPWPRW